MVVTDPPAPPACTGETEGELREKLAAYFLSAPPLDRQDDEQKRRHKAALRRLLRLENRSILQAAGRPAPCRREIWPCCCARCWTPACKPWGPPGSGTVPFRS